MPGWSFDGFSVRLTLPSDRPVVVRAAIMKVLFYLPVVTPWWFEHIVAPIMRRLASVAEVHVLAPAPWRNTGIGPAELQQCLDLHGVTWQIIDSEGHESLRTRAADEKSLVAHVQALAPDVVLCRAADFETVRQFPGMVRFLMEVAAAPFVVDPAMITFTDRPFVVGAMPPRDPGDRSRLEAMIEPLWNEMRAYRQHALPGRKSISSALEIPEDRPMLLLPLEYEHEENFFLQHRPGQESDRAMLTRLAETVAPDCTLVVTDHPLNARHVDRSELRDTLADIGSGVILAEESLLGFSATLALASCADGMLVGDSKSFSLAAAFGVPLMRRSRFATAEWLKAETDLDRFVAAVRTGEATAPCAADARLWFAAHLANEAFHPNDSALTGAELIDRALQPTNPQRWEAGLARIDAVMQEHVS